MRFFSLIADEALAIGDEIVVKVLEIDGDEVRLGIKRSDEMSAESAWAEEEAEFEPVP